MTICVTFEIWALNSYGSPYRSPIRVYRYPASIGRDSAVQDAVDDFTKDWGDDWHNLGIRVRVE